MENMSASANYFSKMLSMVVILGASFVVTVSGHADGTENTPFCCNAYQDLRTVAAEFGDADFSENVSQLLTNFHTSPQLVTYPIDAPPPGQNSEDRNNPADPTIQISPGVGACGKPTTVGSHVCVPLCCSCCGTGSELTVLAMDSVTTYDSGYRNDDYPNLKPIVATDLHLCCGQGINSAFHGHSFKVAEVFQGDLWYSHAKYHAPTLPSPSSQ
eukprot:870524_1